MPCLVSFTARNAPQFGGAMRLQVLDASSSVVLTIIDSTITNCASVAGALAAVRAHQRSVALPPLAFGLLAMGVRVPRATPACTRDRRAARLGEQHGGGGGGRRSLDDVDAMTASCGGSVTCMSI